MELQSLGVQWGELDASSDNVISKSTYEIPTLWMSCFFEEPKFDIEGSSKV